MLITPGILSGKSRLIVLQISNLADEEQTINEQTLLGNITPFNNKDIKEDRNVDLTEERQKDSTGKEPCKATSTSEKHNINESITEEEKAELLKLLNEFRDVFAFSPSELGRTHLVKHIIETEEVKPIRQRPYRVSSA